MSKRRRESASDRPFAYSPLNRGVETSFRLCTLLPGDDRQPVACLLSHDDWKAPKKPYEAISYVWGSSESALSKTITLNGQPFTCTKNLESALRHLRNRGKAEKHHRQLWIDAICIDQSDLAERGQQVQHMYHIYNAAQQVIVWLGDSDPTSDRATQFMLQLKPVLQSVGFSCNEEEDNVKSKFWEEWDDGKDAETLEAIDALIDSKKARYWSAMAKLVQRPWWSRAWTVQELISAKKVVVQVGKVSVPWPLVDMTIQIMLRNTGIENLFARRDRESFQNAIEDAHAFAYERSHRILNGPGPEDFVQLMQVTRCRNSQDPRDKVFSILSLLDINSTKYLYQPDYSESVQVAYTGVAKAHIQRTASLHILSSCYFLAAEPATSDLPSWVPDWQDSVEMAYLGGYSAKDVDFKYSASAAESATVTFSADSSVLTARGVPVDVITDSRLQDSDFDFDYLIASTKEEPWCNWDIQSIVSRLQSLPNIQCGAEKTVLQAVLHTLVADRNPENGKRSQHIKVRRLKTHQWPAELETYLSHVQMFTQGRTLILSHSGYIGLAPVATRPGDKICVLFGCHAPVILRPVPGSSSYFTLIGDAYVHSIMDGEATIETANKVENFAIR